MAMPWSENHFREGRAWRRTDEGSFIYPLLTAVCSNHPDLPLKCASEFKSGNNLWLIHTQLLSHFLHFGLVEASAFTNFPPFRDPSCHPHLHRARLVPSALHQHLVTWKLCWQENWTLFFKILHLGPCGCTSRKIQVPFIIICNTRYCFWEHFLFAGPAVVFWNMVS